LLKEFPQYGRDDKIAFLSLEAGAAGNIAEHQRQGFSGGSRGFHYSTLNHLATSADTGEGFE
jgi:hypothetical protein